MSQRYTWKELKTQVGQGVGLDFANNQLLAYVNQAIELLWPLGNWVGKLKRYKIRVSGNGCGNRLITWPNAIETIEAVNICNRPIGVRTVYFEFMENAVGDIGAHNNWGWGAGYYGGISLLEDRQEVCTNEELIGNRKLRIYTERIEPEGRILLLGYDDHGNYIRTFQNNCWQDGEYINLADSPATTNSTFASIVGVQFDKNPRNGSVYLYSVDENNVQHQLATYDYSTPTPVFRRSILSGLPNPIRNPDGTITNQSECVTVLARMRFQHIIYDTDYAQIGNIGALQAMLKYIYKRNGDQLELAEGYKQEAIQILNEELKQFNGYGAKKMINMGNRQICSTARNLF